MPSPKLFLDVVQRQWANPGAGPPPIGTERHLYNVASDLTDLLQTSAVDPPIALTSASPLATDAMDNLWPEDKRAEMALCRAHQAASWAVKASTAASFFTQTSLLWLCQMQARMLPGDVLSHQDISKLVAATKFTSDAMLNAAKYASRFIGSFVAARRLLWLCHWQADVKSKWKLASSPFRGSNLLEKL